MISEATAGIIDLEILRRISAVPASYTTVALILVGTSALYYIWEHVCKNPIPIYVGDGTKSAKQRWMSDAINLLQEGYNKLLPPRYIDELKMLPDSEFTSALVEMMQGHHTTFTEPEKPNFLVNKVKHELNKNMSHIFPEVREEVDLALPVEFPPCDAQKHNADVKRFLTPLIKEREAGEKSDDYVKPNTAIDWLGYGGASIHTTSQLVTNSLFNLAAHPEYTDMLREEAKHVLIESGGQLTLASMAKLRKMDSFIKESQRFGGAFVASFQRKVKKPITLSDGTYLAPGTWASAPSLAISYDPTIYENPEEFDPLRYYKLREHSEAREEQACCIKKLLNSLGVKEDLKTNYENKQTLHKSHIKFMDIISRLFLTTLAKPRVHP
ncbi:hypothetical protein G7Y89_g787 [Cudoniella acicularis]|uniref:Cytochrome P450 n=1 Tax=Cudoniella acicularis TaxID=354080 RepID=A0A8H4W7Z8_9HELO|nr:hypothetical protein G7Y89_g787 [Cudoniella acicularis]